MPYYTEVDLTSFFSTLIFFSVFVDLNIYKIRCPLSCLIFLEVSDNNVIPSPALIICVTNLSALSVHFPSYPSPLTHFFMKE